MNVALDSKALLNLPSVKSNTHVAKLVTPKNSGEIWIQCLGMNSQHARLITGLDRDFLDNPANTGREVLVVYAGDEIRYPVIIGILEPLFEESEPIRQLQMFSESSGTVVIEAQQEIQLKCGEGSITIRNDGKIVIRGSDLLSRSSGSQRIKGGSVSIN